MTVLEIFNTAIFRRMAGGTAPPALALLVGRTFALWGPWLATGVLCWATWRRPAEWVYLCVVTAAAGLASLLSHGIATGLNVPRPFAVGLSPSWIGHGTSGSMPSTHASVMFTVALALLVRPGLRIAGLWLVSMAGATGWARIYVGVHYPLDILAGLLLAIVITATMTAVLWLLRRATRRSGAAASFVYWRL